MKLRVVKSWHTRAFRFVFYIEEWFDEVDTDDEWEPAGWKKLPNDAEVAWHPFDTQAEAVKVAQALFDKQAAADRDFGDIVVAEWPA